jgi:hypothetical protein
VNVSDVAALADVLAALGVIGSLLFLAFHVRQNTRTVRNQHWESHLDRLSSCFARPLDIQVASVISKGQTNYGDLSGPEKLVFNGWASEYLANVFGSMGFYREGIFDSERAVVGEQRLKWFFGNAGTIQWRHDPTRHPVPKKFEEFVEKHLPQAQNS